MSERRRFMKVVEQGGGAYTPPDGVYWDLSKNVGYCPFPTPTKVYTNDGEKATPTIYVEFENPVYNNNDKTITGLVFFTASYKSQSNWSNYSLMSFDSDNSVNFVVSYGLSSSGCFRTYPWNASSKKYVVCHLGGEKGIDRYLSNTKEWQYRTSNITNGWNSYFDGYIKFGCKYFNNIFNPANYPTNESLIADLANINGLSGGECKLRQFIYYADDTNYTSFEEVFANRDSADIDIRFDAQGNPYNGGTSGELIFTNV